MEALELYPSKAAIEFDQRRGCSRFLLGRLAAEQATLKAVIYPGRCSRGPAALFVD
jgi:hypothetical protein